MVKKAQSGMTIKTKAKAKVKSKADQYDSKPLPKSGKQTPADFMPKSYDKRFKPVKGGGTGNEYLNLGPREKNPDGMSRNGSKVKKKMQMGGEAKSNVFTIPSRNKISIPKRAKNDGVMSKKK